ncbi:hypothetical protein C0J52_24273, partial [Blattella germanica]
SLPKTSIHKASFPSRAHHLLIWWHVCLERDLHSAKLFENVSNHVYNPGLQVEISGIVPLTYLLFSPYLILSILMTSSKSFLLSLMDQYEYCRYQESAFKATSGPCSIFEKYVKHKHKFLLQYFKSMLDRWQKYTVFMTGVRRWPRKDIHATIANMADRHTVRELAQIASRFEISESGFCEVAESPNKWNKALLVSPVMIQLINSTRLVTEEITNIKIVDEKEHHISDLNYIINDKKAWFWKHSDDSQQFRQLKQTSKTIGITYSPIDLYKILVYPGIQIE